MQKKYSTNKLKSPFLLAGMFLVVLLLASVFLMLSTTGAFSPDNRGAVEVNAQISRTNQGLFQVNGDINRTVLNDMVRLANATTLTQRNNQTVVTTGANHLFANNAAITAANSGVRPSFRLFDFTGANNPNSANHMEALTSATWQMVALTATPNRNRIVATFWADSGFRTSQFATGSTTSSGAIYNVTTEANRGLARGALTTIVGTVRRDFPMFDNLATTPNRLPVNWQSSVSGAIQPAQTGGHRINDDQGQADNEFFWLPSLFELGGQTGLTGWNMSTANRAPNARPGTAWLRSRYTRPNYHRPDTVLANGHSDDNARRHEHHQLRPAVHIVIHCTDTAWLSPTTPETNLLGAGTAANPFRIYTARQFAGFAYMVNHPVHSARRDLFRTGHFRVMNNINLSTGVWTRMQTFSGTLDGGGHIITLPNNAGLFTTITGANAFVRNFTLAGGWGNGGVVTTNLLGNARLEDITNRITIMASGTGNVTVGALVTVASGTGVNLGARLNRIVNYGNVTISLTTSTNPIVIVGGFIATANGVGIAITNSANYGNVTVNTSANAMINNSIGVGGFIGRVAVAGATALGDVSIINSYNRGNVTTNHSTWSPAVGGIVGSLGNGANQFAMNFRLTNVFNLQLGTSVAPNRIARMAGLSAAEQGRIFVQNVFSPGASGTHGITDITTIATNNTVGTDTLLERMNAGRGTNNAWIQSNNRTALHANASAVHNVPMLDFITGGAVQHNITWQLGTGGTWATGFTPRTSVDGTYNLTLPNASNVVRANYTLSGWTVNGTLMSVGATATITGATTIVAQYNPVMHQWTSSWSTYPSGHGGQTGQAAGSAIINQTPTQPATPTEPTLIEAGGSWIWSGWTVNTAARTFTGIFTWSPPPPPAQYDWTFSWTTTEGNLSGSGAAGTAYYGVVPTQPLQPTTPDLLEYGGYWTWEGWTTNLATRTFVGLFTWTPPPPPVPYDWTYSWTTSEGGFSGSGAAGSAYYGYVPSEPATPTVPTLIEYGGFWTWDGWVTDATTRTFTGLFTWVPPPPPVPYDWTYSWTTDYGYYYGYGAAGSAYYGYIPQEPFQPSEPPLLEYGGFWTFSGWTVDLYTRTFIGEFIWTPPSSQYMWIYDWYSSCGDFGSYGDVGIAYYDQIPPEPARPDYPPYDYTEGYWTWSGWTVCAYTRRFLGSFTWNAFYIPQYEWTYSWDTNVCDSNGTGSLGYIYDGEIPLEPLRPDYPPPYDDNGFWIWSGWSVDTRDRVITGSFTWVEIPLDQYLWTFSWGVSEGIFGSSGVAGTAYYGESPQEPAIPNYPPLLVEGGSWTWGGWIVNYANRTFTGLFTWNAPIVIVCDDCGYYPCKCEEAGSGFRYWLFALGNWRWLFPLVGGLLLLLLLLIIILAVKKKKKKKEAAEKVQVEESKFVYDDSKDKARRAINKAYNELNSAGDLVSACLSTPKDKILEGQAMGQITKTDKAMQQAEHLVDEFLKVKKAQHTAPKGVANKPLGKR